VSHRPRWLVGGQGKYSSDILVTVTIAGVIVLNFANVKMALLVSGHKGKSFSQLFLQQNDSNKYRFYIARKFGLMW
jgi:hypothetical protein